jgi:multicomponent Na+:H+ antiporter subunit A
MLAPPPPFLLPALVALPLLAALAAVFLPRGRFPLGAAISLIGLALAAGIGAAVHGQGPIEAVFAWAPSLGVTAALRADGLGALFALLITGIGAMLFAFAGSYLAPGQARDRAAVLLLLFQGAMLGAVLADDLVLLFVFWEATSLISFLLVGYDHESAAARRAALQGLLVTVGGGLALLAACVVLATGSGTLRLDATLRTEAAATLPALLLLAFAAFTKSAQMPFQFWLPNAMAAPTPVSTYLHSATMVKLGVYLLARFDPLFGAGPVWRGLLAAIGTATMLIGALLALCETDLKRVLAHSTVTALGALGALTERPHPLVVSTVATTGPTGRACAGPTCSAGSTTSTCAPARIAAWEP